MSVNFRRRALVAAGVNVVLAIGLAIALVVTPTTTSIKVVGGIVLLVFLVVTIEALRRGGQKP